MQCARPAFGSTSLYKDTKRGRVTENEVFDGEPDDDIKGLSTRESGAYVRLYVDFELSTHNDIIAYLPPPPPNTTTPDETR